MKGYSMRALFLAAALLAQSAAHAQTPAPATAPPAAGASEARAKLVAADANKDGKWDKAEWLAAGRRERGFAFMDTDSDGFVTQAELKDGMAKMQARRAAATPETN
jgi:hypothetical protein